MSVFESVDFDHHETVAFFDDQNSGLKSIIAIHSTALGPACGGCRMYPYLNEEAALTDVLRLSRGMSYKNAMADIPFGGGKAVVLGDPNKDKTEGKLLAFGRAVENLGGRYVTAMDVGMKQADLPIIARTTRYAAGYDQPGKTGGDSAPMTALGVFLALKAAVKHRLKTDQLKGLTVAIQGLGKVGMRLAQQLHAEGASLVVADVHAGALREAKEKFGAREVAPDAIVTSECDVLAPCALGAILDDVTVPLLKAKVIAGAANNQLARDRHGAMLRERGVLYAPDYVVNGGGVICVAGQILGWSDAEIEARTRAIAPTLARIFARADAENAPTNIIADRMAQERIARGAAPTPAKFAAAR